MAEEPDSKGLGARPLKLKDPEEVHFTIESYFNKQDPHFEEVYIEIQTSEKTANVDYEKKRRLTQQRPYTVSGLARALGVSRGTLFQYRSLKHYPEDMPLEDRQEILNSIEGAYARIEEWWEGTLASPYSNGAKFNLTNNYSWVDKKTTDDSGKTMSEALDEIDDIADQATEKLEDANAGSETPE